MTYLRAKEFYLRTDDDGYGICSILKGNKEYKCHDGDCRTCNFPMMMTVRDCKDTMISVYLDTMDRLMGERKEEGY